MSKLINKSCVGSDCFTDQPIPISLPLLGLPIPEDTIILKLGQSMTLQWPVSVQVKGRVVCPSLKVKSQK